MDPESLAALSTFLLDLHERSHELGVRDMQRHVFDRLKRLLDCDGGLIAQGNILRGEPVAYDVFLHDRPPEIMESWERIKHEDTAAIRALGNPGTTVNVDVDGSEMDASPAARAHCHAFGIAHILCTAQIDPHANLYWVLSLYRRAPARPFTQADEQLKRALTPHVFSGTRHARLGQLRRVARLSNVHGQFAAIVNPEGIVLEAEPGFADLVSTQWKAWVGPILPPELRPDPESRSKRVVHGSLVASIDPADDIFLVHLRRTLPADTLTDRQREIAEAFSLGETHREIGERLGLSPNTVRRHLANIYEKLGISSKVELDRMNSGIS